MLKIDGIGSIPTIDEINSTNYPGLFLVEYRLFDKSRVYSSSIVDFFTSEVPKNPIVITGFTCKLITNTEPSLTSYTELKKILLNSSYEFWVTSVLCYKGSMMDFFSGDSKFLESPFKEHITKLPIAIPRLTSFKATLRIEALQNEHAVLFGLTGYEYKK